MTRPEFQICLSKLVARFKDYVEEDWFVEELWEFCENKPQRALCDWCSWIVSNSRQKPVPGEFKRFWWDNQFRYEEKKPDGEKQYCEKCNRIGFIWAQKDDNEFCFRCECNQEKEFRSIPQWTLEHGRKGFEKRNHDDWLGKATGNQSQERKDYSAAIEAFQPAAPTA